MSDTDRQRSSNLNAVYVCNSGYRIKLLQFSVPSRITICASLCIYKQLLVKQTVQKKSRGSTSNVQHAEHEFMFSCVHQCA